MILYIHIFYNHAFILLHNFLEGLHMSSWHPDTDLYNYIIQKYTNICIILHICICMLVPYGLYIMYINVAIQIDKYTKPPCHEIR